jgi:hypothetical protein
LVAQNSDVDSFTQANVVKSRQLMVTSLVPAVPLWQSNRALRALQVDQICAAGKSDRGRPGNRVGSIVVDEI